MPSLLEAPTVPGRRTLVVADIHLTRHTPEAVVRDLVCLVERHPRARIVFNGDLFDLSAEGAPRSSRTSELTVREGIGSRPSLRAALARHVLEDGELWFVAGNHDAEVGREGFAEALFSLLEIHEQAARHRVRVTPWFFREEGLHIEHGHLYDPDNAPAHPLVLGRASLGVHFVEEFIAPTRAHTYLNSNDGTPLRLFLSAFRIYGLRAPYVIYRFFHASLGALAKSGPFYRAGHEWVLGERKKDDFQSKGRHSLELADLLLALRARPTLESALSTFERLYLDRVAASVVILVGIAMIAARHLTYGALAIVVGLLVMIWSWMRGYNRYSGKVVDRLRDAAARIVETTGATLVVFSHAHDEAHAGGYANTGSFSFPRTRAGRPYLEIESREGQPRAIPRHLKTS